LDIRSVFKVLGFVSVMGKIWILILVLIVVAGFAVWAVQVYLPSSDDIDKGDMGCDLLDADEASVCCAELHKDDIRIQCVGDWEFVDDKCKFVCDIG